MIEVVCNILGAKIHWHVDASQSSKPEDVIKLVFTTAAFSTFSEREAYETVRASLRRENVSWVEPAPGAWRLHLEGLAAFADQIQTIPWLDGTVTLKPEFKSAVLSPDSPKVGEGRFTFYISPETTLKFSERTPGTENTMRSMSS